MEYELENSDFCGYKKKIGMCFMFTLEILFLEKKKKII